MSVVRSGASLAAVKEGREGSGRLVLVSYHIRHSQREMLRRLAEDSGESQATILRAILDEWGEMKIAQQQSGQGR